MSYILDALRKAEMERQLSRVPGISSRQHLTNAANRFPRKQWLLVGAAVVFGMTVTWLFTRHNAILQQQTSIVAAEDASPEVDATATVSEQGQMPVRTSLPDLRAVSVEQPFASVTKRVTAVNDAVQANVRKETDMLVPPPNVIPVPEKSSPAMPEKVLPTIVQEGETPVQGVKDSGDVASMIAEEIERDWPVPVPAQTAQPVTAVRAEKVLAEHVVPIKEVTQQTQPDAGPINGDVIPVSETPVQEATLPPLLSTLPYRFQSTLPKLVINAQAYADEVEARFVIINMKKYHQGERTREGILVESIGKGNLTLSYQGQAFRMLR